MKTGFKIVALSCVFFSNISMVYSSQAKQRVKKNAQQVIKRNCMNCHSIEGAGSLHNFENLTDAKISRNKIQGVESYDMDLFEKLARSPAHVGKVLTINEKQAIEKWLGKRTRYPASK
jgi:hypothetical protein